MAKQVATSKIVIDPLTRIEGHLRIEAQVTDGKVTSAWSSATMWRGIELILQNRDPRDACHFAQRICGVCTIVHAACSVRAVENALGISPPYNAILIRDLIEAAQFIHDHVIHFYHLHALDWVDVVSALTANPQATATLAQSLSDWPNNTATNFANVQSRLQKMINGGTWSLFGNGYWGHPAYKLSPEANLMAVAHYLEALDWQRSIGKIHALLGGKNPHVQTYIVGGVALPVDLTSKAALNLTQLATLKELFTQAQAFVTKVYIPDLLAIASFYKDWATLGSGHGHYLAYGQFLLWPGDQSTQPEKLFLPRGSILNRDLSGAKPIDHAKIAEHVTHSYYQYAAGDSATLHPWAGETKAHYTGPMPPYDYLNTGANDKYSWLKSPRYDGRPMEVGPLARMLVAYATPTAPSHSAVKTKIDAALAQLQLDSKALFSTLGRMLARGIETWVLVDAALPWLDALTNNIKAGDLQIQQNALWQPTTWPAQAQGYGMGEAPRGALGHWVQIAQGKIKNYQCVVPTTWNAGPRDKDGQPGPYEAALVGTPVADPERPLEVARTIHSFDPCMGCAAHLLDVTKQSFTIVEL